MNLPDAVLQFVYARLAWGVVLAAVALWLLTRKGRPGRAAMGWLAAAIAAVQWMPAPWSPAYWLGLAFQAPSALTAALCAVILQSQFTRGLPTRVLPPVLAAVLAAAGGLLYLDASGWIAQGIYFLGFGPSGAPVAALLIAAGSALAVARGTSVQTASAILVAVSLFMLVRLPTGNLWDAVLDPFLWVASIVVCLKALAAWGRRTPRRLGEVP
jgi:hypothetical protein